MSDGGISFIHRAKTFWGTDSASDEYWGWAYATSLLLAIILNWRRSFFYLCLNSFYGSQASDQAVLLYLLLLLLYENLLAGKVSFCFIIKFSIVPGILLMHIGSIPFIAYLQIVRHPSRVFARERRLRQMCTFRPFIRKSVRMHFNPDTCNGLHSIARYNQKKIPFVYFHMEFNKF